MRPLLPAIFCAALLGAAGCAPDGAALFEREGCLTDGQIAAQIRGSSPAGRPSRMPPYRDLSGREVKALVRHLHE
jgi:hypothetical protein